MQTCDILGVPVATVDRDGAIERITAWVSERSTRYVCACDVHSVMQAQQNSTHMEALQKADLVLADGMPLVWAARSFGERALGRVSGPDLMLDLCERAAREGWRVYLYGGAEGVAKSVAAKLCARFPGLDVAGRQSPPFRPLCEEELAGSLAQIRAAQPHLVWVGLGCPKQEIWMLQNASQLFGCVTIGVGAAFDFHSGRIARAPRWMRDNGLEWLHRLASEPRRLWRRYLVMAPQFVVRAAVQSVRRGRRGGAILEVRRGGHARQD